MPRIQGIHVEPDLWREGSRKCSQLCDGSRLRSMRHVSQSHVCFRCLLLPRADWQKKSWDCCQVISLQAGPALVAFVFNNGCNSRKKMCVCVCLFEKEEANEIEKYERKPLPCVVWSVWYTVFHINGLNGQGKKKACYMSRIVASCLKAPRIHLAVTSLFLSLAQLPFPRQFDQCLSAPIWVSWSLTGTCNRCSFPVRCSGENWSDVHLMFIDSLQTFRSFLLFH